MKKTLATLLALFLVISMIPACFAAGYTVICVDENGNPVENVKVQLCDDKTCSVKKTDAEGKAYFESALPGEWDVHVAKVPEGYVKPEDAIMTSKDGSDIQFTVLTEAGAAAASEATATETDASAADETDNTAASPYQSLEDIDFSDYKLVVVNYWEPWCHWCLQEMPDFEELYQEYKDQGLLIVGMYSYTDGFEEAMEEVGGISYPLIKYEDPDNNCPGGGGVPVTVFYDSEGQILQPEVEEIYAFYRTYLQNRIDTFDIADYPDDDPEELTALIEKLKTDPDAFEAMVQEWAANDLNYMDVFNGFAYGENWRDRIESRLNP